MMLRRKLMCLAVCLVLILSQGVSLVSAGAEDCFTINVDTLDMNSLRVNEYVMANLSAQTQGIRLTKIISASDELTARVRLTIEQMDTQTVVFDKNYGFQSGTFDSGEIYLPYAGNYTVPYLVTLYVEDWVYAMPFMCLQPRLSFNGGCTYGVRMRDYNQALTSDWQMGTMLDLNALRNQGVMDVPLCASNAYIVGSATVSLYGDELSVSLAFAPEANVEVHQSAVYCILNVAELATADPPQMAQPAYGLGEAMDVSGADTALLYIPLLLSYDPVGLQPFGYDLGADPDLQTQLALWNRNFEESYAPRPRHGQEGQVTAPPQVVIGEPTPEPEAGFDQEEPAFDFQQAPLPELGPEDSVG